MQETMSHLREVVTPAGSRVRLAMKIAVAVGSARRFVTGDPDIQLMDVLAGRLIDALAAAERHAAKEEVILERSALESVGDRVEIRELRVDEESGRSCGVVARMLGSVPNPPAPRVETPLPAQIANAWLLPAVYERLRTGRGEFLAELRPAFPLFLRFGGIDYDADEDAIGKLDVFVRQVQRVVTSYGGNLLHLALGDKGAHLYAVFGSPLAHEDDAARAAAAALELRELQSVTAAIDIQIGIAYGRLRSGTYGHERRLTFTCLGDAVNLAARLMSKAPAGKIYAAEKIDTALRNFFTDENLTTLRELALREVASSVDRTREAIALRESGVHKQPRTVDRVLVAMSSDPPYTASLLRKASRIAGRLNSDWYCVYVQTPEERPDRIDSAVQRKLVDNIQLAQSMGAEVVKLQGTDVAEALSRFARDKGVTLLIVGQSRRLGIRRIFHESVVRTLVDNTQGLDVLVVSFGAAAPGQASRE